MKVVASILVVGGWMAACAEAGGGEETDPGTGTSDGGIGGAVAGAGGVGGAMGGMGGSPPMCDEDPCKLTTPQCGCEEGQQCSMQGALRTCIEEGSTPPGESCISGECTPGHICVNNLTGGSAICHEFCSDDGDCSPPGGLCILSIANMSATVCSQNCDPVTDTGCEEPTMKCDIGQEAGGQMRWFTRCTGSGSVDQGEVCTNSNQCLPGLSCFNIPNQTDNNCLTWCRVSPPSSCPSSTACSPFAPAITVGSVEYGACL